jgi:sigma-B regulation protein RsbU (phosphoserine phosphatase)
MTEVYHEVRRLAPKTILWQYTTLENGLHTNYPAGGELPDQQSYDPRKRQWYENTRLNNDIVRVGPIVDAASGQAIVTIAAPVRHPITDVLANMKLPAGWAGRAEKMLVTLNPKADPCQVELTILLQSSYTRTNANWQRGIQLEQLQSDDSDPFRKMISDIRAGKPGVQSMPYRGTPSLWAYGGPEYTQIVPVLIIPYEIVIELADSMEEFLLGQSAQWRLLTGIILLAAFGAAIVLGVVRARSLAKPIAELTEAGRRLAAGDFDTRVDITTGDELQHLGEVFNQTGPKLREREKMKRSLELAKAIQQNLLPTEAPKLKNFEVAGMCTYCDETGGDYYDFIDLIQTGPGTMGIALGDVSGHGIGAALLMATARSMLRINAKYYGTDLAQLFAELNRQLVSDTADDKFMTLFYGVLDDDSSSLVWVSGGHDPALWYHKAGGNIEELPNTGMLMGLAEDADYDQAGPVRLEKGDLVVIGTDGIWETQNIDGEAFGKQRFLEIIRAASNHKAQDICLEVTESVMQFRGSAEQTDDITLVVAKAV